MQARSQKHLRARLQKIKFSSLRKKKMASIRKKIKFSSSRETFVGKQGRKRICEQAKNTKLISVSASKAAKNKIFKLNT